jgi:hypothetical protein
MKKQLKPVELFLALGLVTTITACNATSSSGGGEGEQVGDTPSTEVVASEGGEGDEASSRTESSESSEGGEGGEGGEGSEGGEGGEGGEDRHSAFHSDDPDVNYMVTLGLMKGHMAVGKELLDEGKPKEAEPHLGHPAEELYGDIEEELSKRSVPEFKDTLNAAYDLVKATPGDAQVQTKFEEAIVAIDKAIAALPPDKFKDPKFVLPVIEGLLSTAEREYQAAIADDKFVELVEYQDSRGFVLYATELYKAVTPQVSQQNAEAGKTIETNLTALAKAWPSVNLPQQPILTPAEVEGLIYDINEAIEAIEEST